MKVQNAEYRATKGAGCLMFAMKKCCKCVFALAVAFTPLLGQSSDPPGTIDGAVHPEQIPDVVAFRLFLGALVEGPAAPAALPVGSPPSLVAPSPKQRGKLNPSALNAADMSVLLQALNVWQASIKSAGTAPLSRVDLDVVTEVTMDVLQRQMSPSGFSSLLAQVRSAKKNMKRVPVPDMSN